MNEKMTYYQDDNIPLEVKFLKPFGFPCFKMYFICSISLDETCKSGGRRSPGIRATPYSEPQCPRVTRRIELSFSLLPAKASLGNEATTTTTTTTHELSYPNPSGSSFISFVLSRSTAIAALPTSHGRNQTPSA